MQAVGVHELAVFESTGAEMDEAADVKGFMESKTVYTKYGKRSKDYSESSLQC